MNALPHCVVKSIKEDFKKLNYSEWERCARRDLYRNKTKASSCVILPSVTNKTTGERNPATRQKDSGATTLPTHKKTPTHKSGKSGPNTDQVESAPSSTGRLSRRRLRNGIADLDSISFKKKDNVKTLKLLIMSKKKTLVELEEHCASLLKVNMHMAVDIENTDGHSVSNAREFLIRHEKLGSCIAAFNDWSHYQTGQVKTEIQEAEDTANNKLWGLQEQLRGVNTELVKARAELHNLKTYKQKEHHVMALRIAEITRRIEKLKETQQDEREDLNRMCRTEMKNVEKRYKQKEQEVLSLIAKQNVSYIPCAVKLMASHNQILKTEIGIHKKEIDEQENRNRDLIKSVQELQLSRTNIRKEIFFDVYPKSDKCTPDMDVILNISCEDWLPI
ncbi:hypothetical protein DPEC_G00197810 [Dallia pectoralis]|uniref:Uncharacterized protein n=1 Tax=Dallia pectoralis TaxID=75939 RepID=A0ACC2G8E0_DALPE|nr:hypothetical protein DPEC_G00197810 [Dallia pectoralis]